MTHNKNLNNVARQEALDQRYSQFEKETPTTLFDNPYDYLISLFRKKEKEEYLDETGKRKPLPFNLEIHHIRPKFDGGNNDSSNLILVSPTDHLFAHFVRWKVYKLAGYKRAYILRMSNPDETQQVLRELVLDARQRDREAQRGFFNSDFQRQMGLRGGPIGGAANTDNQFRARQQVGLTFGRQVGISNQSSVIVDFLEGSSIWKFNPNKAPKHLTNKEELKQFYVLVGPQESVADVGRILNTYVPNAITNLNHLNRLIKKERKQAYGWEIYNTLIRSEAIEGYLDFESQNPNAVIELHESFLSFLDFE